MVVIGKVFNVMYNIGHARYVVNFHDGAKAHQDGSRFFDIKICSNKRDLARTLKELRTAGYQEA